MGSVTRYFFLNFFFMGVLIPALVFLTPSCGKKGPPVPPVRAGNLLAVPGDVTYTLAGSQVTLTWTHTIDPVNAKFAPEAFEIYMAIKDIDGCEGCPFVFEPVGLVSMPDMAYQRLLDPGVQNYFRVKAIGKNGMKSALSKTCHINFEQ